MHRRTRVFRRQEATTDVNCGGRVAGSVGGSMASQCCDGDENL
jgi:hypothetical protein